MNRINRILVVVDPSAQRRQPAVDKAIVLAGCLKASVELLICDTAPSNDHRVASTVESLELLDKLASPAYAAGISVKTSVIVGRSLHDTLLEYIRSSNADIVIKDTHHHSLARRTLLRNTDWYLSRGCHIPLLLTKNKAWSDTPIVMAAVDPTHVNDKAVRLERHILNCAASFAAQLGADLHVIHTFVPAAFANVVVSGKLSMSPEYSEALQVENSYRFGEIERMVGPYGVSREHLHVEMGATEDCLLDTVNHHHTDIMIMGASSHGRLHRTLVGSTAATIFESLPCDFLIVQPDDAT